MSALGPRIKIQNSSEKSERFSRINKWNQIETCAKRSRGLVLKQGVVGWMDGWQKRPGSCCGASTDQVTSVAPKGVPMGWERQELGGSFMVVGTSWL